jgi:hypothetical protein
MGTLNLTAKRSDTFYAVPFQILINSLPLDLTDAVIRMQVRKDYGTPIIFEPTITITNALTGSFEIDEQIFNVPACVYKYDIQITLKISGEEEVHTWIKGIFEITNDITRT